MEDSASFEEVKKEYQEFYDFLNAQEGLKESREEARKVMSPSKREVLFQEHSVTVYRYTPVAETLHATPLFIVPSLVNKSSIMDLLQDQSFIEAMLKRGFLVYMIDWGEPTKAQRDCSLEYYLKHYLGRAIRRINKNASSDKLHILGYCLGGMLTTLYCALTESKGVDKMVTMVTPLNFSDGGMLSWWANKDHFEVERIVKSMGNIPSDFFSASFPWLVPTSKIKQTKLLMKKHTDKKFLESFYALDIWATENVGFPGKVYQDVIKFGYQENQLVEDKSWPFESEKLSLDRVKIDVLNMCASFDHISPVGSCEVMEKLLDNANVETQTYGTGHLGFATGKDARGVSTPEYWDKIESFLS